MVNFFCGNQKIKLTIAYDGTAYEGWQVQKTGTGVQEKVETALAKLFPEPATPAWLQPHGHRRSCARHGRAF